MSAHLIRQWIHHMPPTNSRIIHPGAVVVPVEAHFILEFFTVVEVLIAEISTGFLVVCQPEGRGTVRLKLYLNLLENEFFILERNERMLFNQLFFVFIVTYYVTFIVNEKNTYP
jgi:hypothetical protein